MDNNGRAFVFPGQGAQQKGMAADLLKRFHIIVEESSDILGKNIEKLILEDPNNELNLTQYTQPVMYVTNALFYQAHKEDHPDKTANFLAGHSLGEFNALHAAGAFSYVDGLKMVKARGIFISECGAGAMAAIVGLNKSQLENIIQEHQMRSIDVANYNTPTQIVVSGPIDEIPKLQEILSSLKGIMFIPLKVSGAFHSRYMQPASVKFAEFLTSFDFSSPQIPVIANVNALPYSGQSVEMKKLLSNQICRSVLWSDSVLYMHEHGVKEFIELGPGKILQGLIRKII